MKHLQFLNNLVALSRAAYLIVFALMMVGTQVHAADWMKRGDKFYMSKSKDHVTFNVFLCDLDDGDTYAKSDGCIFAQGNGRTYYLIDIYYKNEGSNENPFGKVCARKDMNNTKAWFTNGYGNSEQELEFNSKDFNIQKWGNKNHYCTPAIDFYYPAEMAGKQFTFYYTYTHNNGSSYTMTLGTHTLDASPGYSQTAVRNFSYERSGTSNIKFTLPQLPNDVSSKLADMHIHKATYTFKLIYTKQDNSTVQEQHTFECDKNSTKTYTVEIPSSAGNPRQIDIETRVEDRLTDKENVNYWRYTSSFNTKNALKTVPAPASLSVSYRQFDNSADLSWTAYGASANTGKMFACTPYVYSMETNDKGEALSGSKWSKCGSIDNAAGKMTFGYTDNRVQAEKNYKYMVLNVPTEWINNGVSTTALNNLDADLLNRLGHVESTILNTKPTMSIYALQQDTTVVNKVKLTWQYSRVPTSASTVSFDVLKRSDANSDWAVFKTVSGDANPAAGSVLSVVDNQGQDQTVRYQYKIRLSINNGASQFESDVISAGLLRGSRLKSFAATKGTHETTVRLSWSGEQVGTGNTTYIISRRYVNSNSEYIRINSTSGTSEQYTYEDNTVQPGYYYDYKIDAYSGNILQNSLYDVGFCQARGVISGRVTFGSGSAVDEVRLALHPSDSNDDNTIRGYSQRVDGASTGIAWDADSTSVAKLFGSDKDYTVQMFIRPDEGLNAGAVIGEIPGEGRLAIGGNTGNNYELWLYKPTSFTPEYMHDPTVNLSQLTGNYIAQHGDVLTGTLGGNYKVSIANGATVKLKDVTINGVNNNIYNWSGITCEGNATIVLEGSNTVTGFGDNPGISVSKGNTLTIQGSGSLNVSSRASAAIGGGEREDAGNIIIAGGSINAEGGYASAGIGASQRGSCGDITIKTSVTSVTSEAGSLSTLCIGKGLESTSVGTITIGDVVYYDGANYRNGGQEKLNQISLQYTGNGTGVELAPTDLFDPYLVESSMDYTKVSTDLVLADKEYSLLTVSKAGDQLSIRVNKDSAQTLTATKFTHLKNFSVGGTFGVEEDNAFRGNITEVRVWDHVLTDAELTSNADRMLNGREKGLALYWPMDEGLNRYVFDASYASDLPNGRHATVGNNISVSNIVPSDQQLSRYATTNQNGEFIIRGIPFVGSGSTYTILPSKGIHNFSPTSRNGFIGNGSLTLNSYDFTDISSFPLRGKVTYLNTNIPADSIQFKIDGTLVQDKDGVRVSDSNGEYEISVPIGNHLIEAYRNGHRLTSFPLDGSTYDFKQAEVVNFVDSTLVNVTGRINGGFSDQNAPIGFKGSVNRLGKATIKLSLGKESQCSFNYIVDDHGDGSFGTENIPVESATENIKSTAYRAGGDHDETNFIYITTDENTGEFSAMLPPLKYKVESIKFEGGTDYDNLPVFAQNLPTIDASNAIKEKMLSDTLTLENGEKETYSYSAKMVRQYRATPTLTVMQKNLPEGVFGEKKIEVTNSDFTRDSVEVLRIGESGYQYIYNHPIFMQDKLYGFNIDVAEIYKNLDTGETISEIPLDAVVNISNDASATTIVYAEKGTVAGEEIEMGMPYETSNIEITPNNEGHVDYEFVAGWPNFAGDHVINMSVGVKTEGRTTMWQAPDSRAEALDLIVLGSIGSGTNFITRGPDAVDQIIRRPPGSTSVATLTNKEINSTSRSVAGTHSVSDTGGVMLSETPTFEISTGTAFGVAVLTSSKFKIDAKQKLSTSSGWSDTSVATNTNVYSVTNAMATPSSMPINIATMTYTPENGDTYIGRSTNLLFSNGRILGLFKQEGGDYQIKDQNGITVSQEFGTAFVYPQAYIENTLIPNWENIIKSRLVEGFITSDHTNAANTPVVPGKVVYYTNWKPGDPEFGKSNSDSIFWGMDRIISANGCPSYRPVNGTDDPNAIDEVQDALNQIKMWQARIADNEQDKLEAFANDQLLIENYSIATGSKVSQTTEQTFKESTSHKHEYTFAVNTEMKTGVTFNDAGAFVICKMVMTDGGSQTIASDNTKSTSVAWSMSDSDPRTALSVDVYKSPAGWGPIFRTRGGQTANPYESGSFTKYYQPGTKLNEATMKVENPQLKVKGSSEITDVPTGGQAKFTLELSNQSETNDLCTYVLKVKDKTNPNGAILSIDGYVLSNGQAGRAIKMKGHETVTKTLVVTQSDPSVTDYENIVLQLKSEKDASIESEPVTLRVHFVPSSTSVELGVDHTVLNKAFKDENGGLIAKMFNIDRGDSNFLGLRLRYRRKGIDTWNLVKQWSPLDSLQRLGYEPLDPGSTFTQPVVFPEDGIYELQAQTFGKYGNQEVTYESEIIEVTQDTHGPKMLGMVSPENGQLTYLNRNNMHLRFNEVLNGNSISKSDNFRIEGGMNNVLFNGQYPDVAVQLNSEEISTDARFDLAHTDYAFDVWFYRQGDGTIISLGTENNLLSLSTHDDGYLRARVGEETDVYDTGVQLPKDKWIYMALNYKLKTASDAHNRISMLYVTADDTQPNYIGRDVPAKDLESGGRLSIGGDGMQGMISNLAIWNSDITAQELYETRQEVRAAYTPGLVGYWRMDEGHGTQITDRARSRHMHMPTESWYVNNENRAAHLSGEDSEPIKIDITTFNPSSSDDYAIEMWFRGTEAENPQKSTLISVRNGATSIRENVDSVYVDTEGQDPYWKYTVKNTTSEIISTIGYNEGKLGLNIVEHLTVQETGHPTGSPVSTTTTNEKKNVVLTDKSYLDGNWHHFALNVRRGRSAIVYIDGEPVRVLPETNIPGISSKYLMIGGEMLGNEKSTNLFCGDVDEIRIWNASLDGKLISERLFQRMDNSYPGLVGYFPMEEIHRTQQGKVTTDFSTANFGEPGSRLTLSGPVEQSTNAPSLVPGSTKMRMEDVQFDFTVSNDEIYFTFPDSSLPLMDNNDFVASISYIKDEHGNNSEVVQWPFHADFASVSWEGTSGETALNITKKWNETYTFSAPLYNNTGQPQSYEITGLPEWMAVDKPIGTVVNETDMVEFHISQTVPVGHYTEYIYVTDRLGLRRVLKIVLTVEGDVPNWSVDTNLYESNMTLTGQLYVGDKISENSQSIIAAFDELGLCRGIAKPRYVATRDAYYIDMIIYGGSVTELTTAERDITFRLYDASKGVIYPVVKVQLPNGTVSHTVTYAPDANVGSYSYPVIFTSTNELLQKQKLQRGWTWTSIYLQPQSTAIADVLPKIPSEVKRFKNIKSKTEFATCLIDGSGYTGSLEQILPGKMYKMQLSTTTDVEIYGNTINPADAPQTIYPGYNWIGSISTNVMSLEEAFADLSPEKDDMVKTRTAMATYNGAGIWEGTLSSIAPGEGYIYLSKSDQTKTFRYPRFSTQSLSPRRAPRRAITLTHFQPMDDHLFPDNMNVIAIVEQDGQRIEDAEVAAFVGDECRGAITAIDGYYYLTIMGSAADDANKQIDIRVWDGSREYTLGNLQFISDAFYGTLSSPVAYDLDTATGITSTSWTEGDDDAWYTLQGLKVSHLKKDKPAFPGVYIHRGKRVVIK